MIEPVLSDDALLADMNAPMDDPAEFRLWWLGQSGYVVSHRSRWLIIDPYLSDSLTKKYAGTEKPHVRMSRRVVAPEALGAILESAPVISSSHAHTDHLDPETLRPLLRSLRHLPAVFCPESIATLARERAGCCGIDSPPRFRLLDDARITAFGGISATAIASAHDQLERDERGRSKYLGYVLRLMHLPKSEPSTDRNGSNREPVREWTIYHSGDTVVYDGLVERLLKEGPIDIAILPINGKVGNMGGRDAARLAKSINARLVVPCHYDMFEFNTASPADEFIPECEKLGQPYRVLKLGERFSSSELPARE